MSSGLDERRDEFHLYKEEVQSRGKPFFPFGMWHDSVMAFVAVLVIIGLTCVWYFTSGEDPDTCGSGDSCLLGPRYSEPADPGTTNFVPRPDWYFYFLFYLLRIFKWPDTVILGTVGIPTILLIILLLLPFLDVRRERRLLRRPVAVIAVVLVVLSMGVLTYKGATAKEALASEVVAAVPTWAERQGFQNNADAVEGAKIFASSGCTACHTYLGTGSSNLGAPDLSDIGTSGRTAAQFADYVADPSKFGNNVMPKFESLGEQQLNQLGEFLAASKGPK
jgi:quinol---cytochrome c reductase cytochrome c subunit, bacillus type